jgi:hypothetical protein
LDEINFRTTSSADNNNKRQLSISPQKHIFQMLVMLYNPPVLETFEGKGKYYSPQFTWNQTVGPTALTFLTSDKLGKKYKNDIFVTDVNNGRIYHLKLNLNRTELLLKGLLGDKVADIDKELKKCYICWRFWFDH